jgi:uncharacterized membrane protein YeaQ/YmgE (transglycosylase-associated protein family)
MGTLIVWLLVGLIAGALASAIVPGRTPGGTIGAVAVGILGGILGGWILDALDVSSNLSWIGSLLVAIVGAVIILFALRAMNDRGRAQRRA